MATENTFISINTLEQWFPYRAFTRQHGEILCYGTSFPPTFHEVLLAHASPNDWPIVAKHANKDEPRGIINAEPATITSESFPSLAEQPRLWLKILQLTVEVRSYEGGPG